MRVAAFNSGRQVIASGMVLLAAGETAMSVTVDDVAIGFNFAENGGLMVAHPNQIHPKLVHYDMFNFSNPAGSTYVVPRALKVNGFDLTVSLAVRAIGNGLQMMRVVEYSIHFTDNL